MVANEGKVILNKAYGKDGTTHNKPLTTQHKFDIGSVSKQFTAAGIMRLKDQGKLDFDDLLEKYIPEINYPSITIKNLMNHTSGIPETMKYFTKQYRKDQVKYPITNQRMISVLATKNLPKYFEPGENWKYSNTGYYLLASIIERVSGLPYSQFMKLEFFKPLGMDDTSVYQVNNDNKFNLNRSYGYIEKFDGSTRPFDQIPFYFLVGSGGIYSTAKDLFTWSQALLSQELFSKDSWEKALSSTEYGNNQLKEYGFGWGLKPSKSGKKAIKHSGDWRGFTTGFAIYPDAQQTIVILTNNNSHDAIDDIHSSLNDLLEGKETSPVKQSLSKVLYPILINSNLTKAKSIINNAIKPDNNDYLTDKKMINRLGYEMLKLKKVQEAIVVFKFNNDKYSDTPNTFDSLAEAYSISGELEKASNLLDRMESLFPKYIDYEDRKKKLKLI
ncbi:hypothetical protein BI291_17410 [Thalassotalea sp. PP2-459]|nr:hypothetical protein BI291_17410 [Thalassotalea sp. PP2-459]